MTTNTNAALVADAQINAIACALAELDGYDPKDQNCGLYDLRWSGGPNPEPEGDAWHMDYLPKAEKIASALTTAAAVPLEGFVMVPVELAERVQESLGEFLMDHGWSQRDMDTSDDFGAVLLAAAPKAEPVPAGEREELREGASYESMNLAAMVLSDCGHSSNYQPLLERVAGRIDRHVERLLTAQREDLTTRAQAAPAAVAHQGVVAWPVMPPSKGQSPVLFEDGYAEGWAKCLEACRAALASAPTAQPTPPAVVEPPELSPDFTDTARAALLWVLWHHQGGSSPVGQPIRFALGMGQHDRLNEHQLAEAKRWERLHPVNPAVFPRGPEPLTLEAINAMAHEHPAEDLCGWSYRMGIADAERHHGIKGGQHGAE